eukprot:TRINITY_DN14892_c0_g1_i1.p4 TRINITY_DN14892_c0_g1~~TRINITY_DN14892_c0_g1_i1.p4  ORF type:complete len:136 (-),score=18.91 TRINITY_DN14892_c0_g1_i1:593-1000(-)
MGNHWQKYGPIYLVSLALPLIMADLTRHVMLDHGWCGAACAMYRDDNCPYADIRCLSLVGWLVTIVFTYSGFACLIIGTLWSANMVGKIKVAWSKIRTARQIQTDQSSSSVRKEDAVCDGCPGCVSCNGGGVEHG